MYLLHHYRPMRMRRMFAALAALLLALTANAAIRYEKSDSLKVVQWQNEALSVPAEEHIFFFARKMLRTPYAIHTLEVYDPEQVIINLRKLDCTTFVESVMALTLSMRHEQPSFQLYCRYIEKLRYRNGENRGYVSRLHYFSDWIADNERKKLVKEVGCPDLKAFDGNRKLNLFFMSRYSHKYKALTKHPQWVKEVRRHEEALSGKQVYFISRRTICNNPPALKKAVKDGDILATVTNVKGLDVSHLGIAVWKDGYLHWYNASRVHKKVVYEPKTMCRYLHDNPRIAGIRVIRLAENP